MRSCASRSPDIASWYSGIGLGEGPGSPAATAKNGNAPNTSNSRNIPAQNRPAPTGASPIGTPGRGGSYKSTLLFRGPYGEVLSWGGAGSIVTVVTRPVLARWAIPKACAGGRPMDRTTSTGSSFPHRRRRRSKSNSPHWRTSDGHAWDRARVLLDVRNRWS